MDGGAGVRTSTRLLTAVAIAALAISSLGACATATRPIPPNPKGPELTELTNRELDLQWQYIGLTPDSPRPTVKVVRFIGPDEAKQVYSDCMTESGFPFYGANGPTDDADNYERLAIYICTAKYPQPPATYGLYSAAQHDFLYDYYLDTLIPCVRSSGIKLNDVPSRDEYKSTTSFSWSPLDQLSKVGDDLRFVIESRCPAYPSGFRPWELGISQ